MLQKYSYASILPVLAPLFLQDDGGGMPWWVWLIIIIVLLIIFLVALVQTQEPGPPLPELKAELELPVEKEPVVEEPVEKTVEEPTAGEVEVETVVEKPELVVEVPPDDLRRIEGIGPKISSVLQEAGVRTFTNLAEADVDGLDKILDEAGIRIANPSTWPDQAKLAAAGKWDELKKLQDSLKGGRKA